MRALLQRVNSAEVHINNQLYSQINKGLLILLGIGNNDDIKDIQYLIDKIINLRIFNNNQNKMNLSIVDIKGDILIVSQFTLFANITKGRRPGFSESANSKIAENLYNIFLNQFDDYNLKIQSGKFGAMMNIHLINNGPATFMLDSKI